jgi:carbon-monoxide dehydrogenase large subunit
VSILGTRVTRTEDPRFLTEGGRYTDDHRFDGMLWVTFVRSPMPHATITGIDASDARALPGVGAVFTASDLDLGDTPFDFPPLVGPFTRPYLAHDVVRYVGEPVAVIVSETGAEGEDAVDMVIVDYEPLPAVVDVEDAARDAVVLHPHAGTNVTLAIPDDPVDLSGCDVVVRQRIVNQRVATAPLEVQATACRWNGTGRLEMWTGSQGPHPIRDALCDIYGLAKEDVRVVSPDVGGGFGAKSFPSAETLMLPAVAKRVGRPVMWTETRSDSMTAWGHGRGQLQDVVIGGTRDGRILAYDLTVLQDVGAYPRIASFLPYLTKHMHPGVYAIPRTACRTKSVVTNTTPVQAFRGAGRPEAAAAIERAVDLFAAEIGMDPAEVRRINVVAPDQFPYETTGGAVYDSGQYEKALDLAVEHAGYQELRAEQQRRRTAGDRVQLGVGLALYVEVTAFGGGTDHGSVEIQPDGSALVRTGTFPHGQGHVTGWQMLVHERTGIDIDNIEVVFGDTDTVPHGERTGGSRSVQIGGTQVWRAAGYVVDQARIIAARLLEADVADVVLDTAAGQFHVAGTPSIGRSWADVATEAAAADEQLAAEGDFVATSGTYPSGAHVAVVEVDTETGAARVKRFVALDDAGVILNPLLAEGQVHGGLAQGVAQALYEEFRYDADGIPLTTNFADYAIVSPTELPTFETVHLETASPTNDLGAKGIGESGTIGATPAVQNGVIDALAHLGVRHIDMPCTPERVWRAIKASRA